MAALASLASASSLLKVTNHDIFLIRAPSLWNKLSNSFSQPSHSDSCSHSVYSTCQFIVVTTCTACHSLTFSLHAQNLSFPQILSTIDSWYPTDCLSWSLFELILLDGFFLVFSSLIFVFNGYMWQTKLITCQHHNNSTTNLRCAKISFVNWLTIFITQWSFITRWKSWSFDSSAGELAHVTEWLPKNLWVLQCKIFTGPMPFSSCHPISNVKSLKNSVWNHYCSCRCISY